jgi:predicted nucleic acid-binding protein
LKEVVLDASVLWKWFTPSRERGLAETRQLALEYRQGGLAIAVPSLVFLEVLNIAGRRLHAGQSELLELATTLEDLRFQVIEPDLSSVAEWVALGLTAYDAVYVALAAELGRELITDDSEVLEVAPRIARSLTRS